MKRIKNNKIVRIVYTKLYNFFLHIVSLPFLLLPIQKKKIVIVSYFGKGYGDNLKYITESLLKEEPDVNIVWLLSKKLKRSNFNSRIKIEKYNILTTIYHLATAKVWIDNARKHIYPIKRKGQFYIQTWHGGIALKKVERDAENKLSYNYVEIAKNDSKMADLFVSNSIFCTKMYQRAFWYNGKILEVGSPRNDILVNLEKSDESIKKVFTHFKIKSDDKIILYAPTFRKNINESTYNLEFEKIIEKLYKKYNTKYKILLRLHPNISNKINLFKYDENILNATDYPDMQELLLAADILITDYSSSMFDYMILKRPIIIYANDYDKYKKERDFYFDLRELPFIFTKKNEELLEEITKINNEKIKKDYEDFFKKVGLNETGKASEEVSKIILKRIRE